MSLLGQITDLLDGDDDSGNGADKKGLLEMATGLMGETGGMSGLVSALQDGGLGDQVKSWLGNGANVSVSADQLRSALGDDKIATIAAKFGLDTDAAASQLSNFLPGLMDKLSPDGNAPADGDVMKQVTGLLSGFLKK